MAFYPFPATLQKATTRFENGNFGLWFYKMVPLDKEKGFKAATPTAGDKNVAAFYHRTYDELKRNASLQELLGKKHSEQQRFCRMHAANSARMIEIRAELKSPLITGIGQTHPNEVGMTFDHTMGVPYIPATSIKGLVRLAHILNLMMDEEKASFLISEDKDELDDTHPASRIPEIFGGAMKDGKKVGLFRGNVLFLDVYPETIPDLHVDIMNPHYGAYYADDKDEIPPADYLDPNPIQFLTVKSGTVFVFRAVVYYPPELLEAIQLAFDEALTGQGVGAKTAVGYGRFSICHSDAKARTSISYEEAGGMPAQNKSTALSQPKAEIWENAILTWHPGNQQITATFGNKIATSIGKDLVPENLGSNLFRKRKKRKAVKVKSIEVEKEGNAYKILKIYAG